VDTNVLNVPFLRELTTLKIDVSPYMIFLAREQTFQSNKVEPHFSNEEYQQYLSLKSSSQAQPFTSLSTNCISQTLEC